MYVAGERNVDGTRIPGCTVRMMGAVSPTPIAIARKMPVKIWGNATGVPTLRMYWTGFAPEPNAASRIGRGTEEKARSAVRKTYGHMKNESVNTPAMKLSPQPK